MRTATGPIAPPAGLVAASPADRPGRRIGDVVVELGFAAREVVERAVAQAHPEGRPVGKVLVENGTISSCQLARALAERSGLDYVDLNLFEVDKGAASLISVADARRSEAIPIAFVDDRTLLVAASNPANVLGLDNVAIITGYELRVAIVSSEELDALIAQLSTLGDSVAEIEEPHEEEEPPPVLEMRESAEEAPVIKLVHSVIADAVERGASDIHFDPSSGDMRVRFRVDGVVTDAMTVPRRLVAGLVSRVKIMAELDIAERRVPQDGRIALTVDGGYIDLRIATLPVLHGESLVMRILDKGRMVMELDRLGMQARDRERLQGAVAKMQGAVLVAGPTGVGKTTTLYAVLSDVNSPDRTLISIEDPVEYEVEGVKQVQVNERTGLGFAAGLRSMVRSDPDVLMVGEIRDRPTAQTAIESALTGHLVLSTLHTNNGPMAAARLIDMGIEPFLVASGVECVVAQRLARRLCEECRQPLEVGPQELEQNHFGPGLDGFTAYEASGCMRCHDSGYKGRIGIYEVMVLSPEIRSLILRKATADEIGEAAVAGGMRRLREDGLDKVRAGITSMAELLRVLGG